MLLIDTPIEKDCYPKRDLGLSQGLFFQQTQ